MNQPQDSQRGYALITVLLLVALVMALLTGYFTLTQIDMSTTRSSMDGTRGLYAAEAGVNVRSETIRGIFENYNLPSGTAPNTTPGQTPCVGGNDGSGDYGCVSYALQDRAVSTYVEEMAGNPANVVIPRGERFQNLNAQEYRYAVASIARGSGGRVEADLDMRVKNRLVPLFQFAVFYNKDLEILPGPAMFLSGPIHTNGDLYTDAAASLDIAGQVSVAGSYFRGRKDANSCNGAPVRVADPAAQTEVPACAGGRRQILDSEVAGWNGMIQIGVDPVEVPQPEALDPTPGRLYWDRADLRIVLDLNGGGPVIEVRNADGSVDAAGSATLGGCGSAAGTSLSFYNNREGSSIRMLDVDVTDLLDCIHATPALMGGKALDDNTDRGLVFYLGVDGPNSGVMNNYGVRLRNGDEIEAGAIGAPAVRGLTVVSNQAAYIEGHYNRINKIPAAVLCDSINILSDDWVDADSLTALTSSNRDAVPTTVNAAILAGSDTSGGIEGVAGQNLGGYNGGVENFPRFHEDWNGVALTYRGSLVSLNVPQHVDGAWGIGSPWYQAPIRDWDYDTDFNDPANLPPLAPRFTYLRQEMFVREFQ